MKRFVREHSFLFSLLTSVVSSVISGLLLNRYSSKWTSKEIMIFNFPGDLFVRLMKVSLVPLFLSSVISVIGSIETKTSWKITARAWFFFLLSTITSVVIGIVFSVVISPGNLNHNINDKVGNIFVTDVNSFLDILR